MLALQLQDGSGGGGGAVDEWPASAQVVGDGLDSGRCIAKVSDFGLAARLKRSLSSSVDSDTTSGLPATRSGMLYIMTEYLVKLADCNAISSCTLRIMSLSRTLKSDVIGLDFYFNYLIDHGNNNNNNNRTWKRE